MPKFIAFLRAVNVGGRTVKMDRLRTCFEEMKLSSVETFIASGNVLFESRVRKSEALETTIEEALRSTFGFEVTTFVRTTVEVAAAAAYPAFSDGDMAGAHALYIGFLKKEPSADSKKKLMAFRSDLHDFVIHGREVYWLSHQATSESKFSGAVLEKALGIPATLRNVTTVRKLAAKTD